MRAEDVVYEATDGTLRATAVGAGIAVNWMGADVIVTRTRVLILPYNRLLGLRSCQPVIVIPRGAGGLKSSRFVRVCSLTSPPALLSDGRLSLSLSGGVGLAVSRSLTLSGVDGPRFIEAFGKR